MRQGLIEHFRAPKHRTHAPHCGRVPRANLAVKGRRAVEHARHVGALSPIPSAHILVERGRSFEQRAGVPDIRYLPPVDGGVEGRGSVEPVVMFEG